MKIRELTFCLFLALIMAVTFIPTGAFAEAEEEVPSLPASADEESGAAEKGAPENGLEPADPSDVPDLGEYGSAERKGAAAKELLRSSGQNVYTMGETVNQEIPADSMVTLQVQGLGTSETPCHLFLQNNSGGKLGFRAEAQAGEDTITKNTITADNVYQGDGDSLKGTGEVWSLSGNSYDNYIYNLRDGDRIVLSAGADSSVSYAFTAQELTVGNTCKYGNFSYEHLYREAQLIPIGFYKNSPRAAALYLSNSSAQDFAFGIVDGAGNMVGDSSGYLVTELGGSSYTDNGYTFNADQNYYLLVFYDTYMQGPDNSRHGAPSASSSSYDIKYSMLPRSVAKYKVTGVANKTWSGNAQTMNLKLSYRYVVLAKGTDYTVTYSNNKNVGTATITIKGKAPYTGTVKKYFRINPRGTSIWKLKKKKKGFTVNWKRQLKKMSTSTVTGYQVQYSTSSAFKSGNKLVTVKGCTKKSKTVKKLKKKKKYYVRVRTYKTIGTKTYYSVWSKAKSVKTK